MGKFEVELVFAKMNGGGDKSELLKVEKFISFRKVKTKKYKL